MRNRVLIVATSRKTKGGITSVLLSYETGEQWKKYNCRWIETHVDGCFAVKFFQMLAGLAIYLVHLPFARLVHVHLSAPPSAKRKCLFLFPASLLRKKIIVHFHTTGIEAKYYRLYRYVFSVADAIVVLSNQSKNEIVQTFGVADKTIVLYNPCSTLAQYNVAQKTRSILFAGKICRAKGCYDLIQAFADIAEKYPEWQLILAGDGEEKGEVKAFAESLEVISRCSFPGWIGGALKDKFFSEASIFCLPSYVEGFPMAVLDAWGYGVSVVTTPVGGIVDFARDSENLLLFKPGDVKALASCLEKLICDETLRLTLSENAYRMASEVFDTQVINRQIGELYKKVLN